MSERSKYVVVLVVAAATILIGGSYLRPEEDVANVPPPSDAEISRLAALSARRSLEGGTLFFASLADQVNVALTRLPDLDATGVVWAGGFVVTVPIDRSRTAVDVVAGSGETTTGAVTARSPSMPVAGIRVAQPLSAAPARRAPVFPEPGDWIAAVWRSEAGPEFAPGTFTGTAAVRCGVAEGEELVSSLSLSPLMAGGGVFDIDGRLLALVVPCDGRFVAMSERSVRALIDAAGTLEGQLLARYGLRLGPLDAAEAEHFGVTDGMLVREVWTGYAADASGLAPGDLVREIDGSPLATPDDLAVLAAAESSGPFVLTLRRRNATVTLSLSAEEASDVAPEAPNVGLSFAPPEGLLIAQVQPGSPAGRVGLQPGDRLRRIDQRDAQSVSQAERLLGRGRGTPAFLEIERGGRRWGVLLSP